MSLPLSKFRVLATVLPAALLSGGAPAAAAPPAAAPSASALAQQPSVIFEHSARSGTLRRLDGKGRYRLTLRGVGARSSYITDRTGRAAGRVGTKDAVTALFGTGSRVAAMEVPGAPRGRDAMAVRLSNPSYDAPQATLSFAARTLTRTPGTGRTPDGRAVDATVAPAFGAASLLVGSPHDGQYCSAQVFPGNGDTTTYWANITGYSKWPTDEWASAPSLSTNSGNNSYMAWESKGEDGRGCHNSVTIGYGQWNQTPSTTETITTTMTYAIGNVSTVNCVSTVTQLGTCSFTESRSGLFGTDLMVNYTIFG